MTEFGKLGKFGSKISLSFKKLKWRNIQNHSQSILGTNNFLFRRCTNESNLLLELDIIDINFKNVRIWNLASKCYAHTMKRVTTLDNIQILFVSIQIFHTFPSLFLEHITLDVKQSEFQWEILAKARIRANFNGKFFLLDAWPNKPIGSIVTLYAKFPLSYNGAHWIERTSYESRGISFGIWNVAKRILFIYKYIYMVHHI